MTAEGALVAGRYRLGRQIGSGAMGIVWQAHDERLHRTVAVKQLLLQPGLSAAQAEEARRRCMREGRIAARLTHPNAITVYDVAEHDDDPWLIMEYLPSKSLAIVLSEQGTIAPTEAARIGAQVASALVAAHAAGIVHRDIKPANVLLGDDGTVKITDFGISRATGDVTVTATGMLAGTPAYLAPEVAKGEDPKPAADVFSLGSTLYTAVEGHSPFGLSENTLALLYAVAAGKITPPRQAGPLTALLMQLLRVEPSERPALTTTRDNLQAVAEGRQPLSVAAPTDRIAGNRLPPARPAPPSQQRQAPWASAPPQAMGPPSPPDGTRLDVHPFTEPSRSGPVLREPAPTPPRPVNPPPARPGQGQGQGPRKNDRVRSIVLTVLAVVAAALVGILIASMISGGDDDANNGQGQPSTTTTTEESTASQDDLSDSPSSTTSTTTTEKTTTTTTEDAPTQTPEQAVRDYYGLLPGNCPAAWALMTSNAQQKSGGWDTYNQFWSGLSSVQVEETSAQGNQVTARIRYVSSGGAQSADTYRLMLVDQGGQLMIDNFQRL
jgi:eukaryotic-like serine/threonine-protein kinase